MKTNLKTQTYFVLTTEDDKVIAIINCPAGEHDLSTQINQAICEEFDCDKSVIKSVLISDIETLNEITEFDYDIRFTADIVSEEQDYEDNEKFNLIRTESY